MKKFKEVTKTTEDDILDEGIISTAFNVATVAYITRWLTTPWEKWPAYKLDLIDNKGKRTDKKAVTKEDKDALSVLNLFILQLRRIFRFVMSEGVLKLMVGLYLTKSIFRK